MLVFFSRLLTVVGYLGAVAFALVPFGILTSRLIPVVDLFAQFLLGAIVAGALLGLAALLTRRYRLAGIVGGLWVLCIALAWPYQQQPSAEAQERRLKLLSFNIFFPNTKLADVVTQVRAVNADIVVLLEVAPPNRDQLRGLDNDYPYRIECWQKTRCDILVLSRVPLKDLEPSLTVINTPPAWAAAELEFKGCRFSLIAAHLSLPFPFHTPGQQGARAESLTQIVTQVAGPKILAGDFNAAPWGAIMSDIADTAHMRLLTGFGATWPTHFPQIVGIPIDHVLASEGFTFLSRELKLFPGSDHRGVLTEIALPPQDKCGAPPA